MTTFICPIAGVGSRLWPITKTKPKALIRVAGKRIIDHIMEKIKEIINPQDKIIFIVGYKKNQLIDYLNSHYGAKFHLKYIEQKPIGFKNNLPFYSGLGDAISLAAPYGARTSCFIFLSDRYPVESFNPMITKLKSRGLDGLLNVTKVPDPHNYGVVKINDSQLVEKFVEKPPYFISELAQSGAYYFSKTCTPRLFDLLTEQAQQPIQNQNEHQVTPIIQKLIDEDYKIGINQMHKPVLDFGRPERLLTSNKYLIEQISKREGSKKKVKLGKGSLIKHSTLGPYVSVGDNTILHSVRIANSIIGDNCNLTNLNTAYLIIDDDTNMNNLSKKSIQVSTSLNH